MTFWLNLFTQALFSFDFYRRKSFQSIASPCLLFLQWFWRSLTRRATPTPPLGRLTWRKLIFDMSHMRNLVCLCDSEVRPTDWRCRVRFDRRVDSRARALFASLRTSADHRHTRTRKVGDRFCCHFRSATHLQWCECQVNTHTHTAGRHSPHHTPARFLLSNNVRQTVEFRSQVHPTPSLFLPSPRPSSLNLFVCLQYSLQSQSLWKEKYNIPAQISCSHTALGAANERNFFRFNFELFSKFLLLFSLLFSPWVCVCVCVCLWPTLFS